MRRDNGKRTGMQKIIGVDQLGSYVIHFPELGRKLKSQSAAIALEYFLGWEGKQRNSDRWIFKTIEEFELETGLTRRQQDRAIKTLLKLGLIEKKLMGIPAKRNFRLGIKAVQTWWIGHACPISDEQLGTGTAEAVVQNVQTITSDTRHDTATPTRETLSQNTKDEFKFMHRFRMEEGIARAKEEMRKQREQETKNKESPIIPSGDNPTISGTS